MAAVTPARVGPGTPEPAATGGAPATGGAAAAGELRGAARHTAANLVGVFLAGAAGFGLHIIVTRSWTVPEAGLFFTATSVFLIGYATARLGAGVGAVYFVSRYRALGQPDRIRPLLVAALLPVAAMGAAFAVAGWFAAAGLAGLLWTAPAPGAVSALRTLLLFIPAAALTDVALAACRGFGAMRPLLLVERLGRTGLQVLGVVLVAMVGLSVTTALPLAWALPYVPAGAAGLAWLAVLVRRAERATGAKAPAAGGWALVRAEFPPFWRYTGPRALSGLAQMAIQRVDIVLLGALRGLADAALYTAATRFLALGQLVGQALSTAVQHRLAAHLARRDTAAAGQLYQAATGWLVLLTWPGYLLVAIFARPLLALFGPAYVAAAPVTVFLALTMLVATGCGMVDAVLNMAGKTSWTFYNALAALAVNVLANLLLIPRFGMAGAAAAWAASIAVANLVPLAQLQRGFGLHPFGRGTLTAAGLALGCFGVPGVVVLVTVGPRWPAQAAVAVAGLVTYAVGAWHWRGTLHLDTLRTLRRADQAPEPAR